VVRESDRVECFGEDYSAGDIGEAIGALLVFGFVAFELCKFRQVGQERLRAVRIVAPGAIVERWQDGEAGGETVGRGVCVLTCDGEVQEFAGAGAFPGFVAALG